MHLGEAGPVAKALSNDIIVIVVTLVLVLSFPSVHPASNPNPSVRDAVLGNPQAGNVHRENRVLMTLKQKQNKTKKTPPQKEKEFSGY